MTPTTKDIAILEELLPHMMRTLVLRGIVTEKSLQSAKRLQTLFQRHTRTASEDFSILIALHDDFLADACDLWSRGRRYQAIVLFATAVEQCLNSHYRLALLSRGLSNDEVTVIIRSQSLDAKLTWLLKMSSGDKLPASLVARLRIAFEVRNSIVHYKAVPGHPDKGDDSHDAIERRIRNLKRVSFRRDFSRLQRYLDQVILRVDPSFRLAHDAANILKDLWRDRRRTKAKQSAAPNSRGLGVGDALP